MPTATRTSPTKTWTAAVLLLIALVASAWLAKTWMTETAQAEAVEQAVSQVTVPTTWTETVNSGEPGRILCLGGNACPSARITWQTPEPLSVLDMTLLVADAGWNMTIDGDCQPRPNVTGLGPVCSGSATVGDLDIQIYQSRANGQPGAEVTLFVNGPR